MSNPFFAGDRQLKNKDAWNGSIYLWDKEEPVLSDNAHLVQSEELRNAKLIKLPKSFNVMTMSTKEADTAGAWNDVINSINDMSPIPDCSKMYRSFLDVYMLVSVWLFYWTLSKLFCIFVRHFFVRNFYHASFGILSCFFGVLLIVVLSDKTISKKIRLAVLLFCIVDGSFVGYSSNHESFSTFSPPPFAIPLSIGFALQLFGQNFGRIRRIQLLSFMFFPAIAFYLIVATFHDALQFSFVIWAVTMIFAAFVDFQIKVIRFRKNPTDDDCVLMEQIISIVLLLAVNYFFNYLFSVSYST